MQFYQLLFMYQLINHELMVISGIYNFYGDIIFLNFHSFISSWIHFYGVWCILKHYIKRYYVKFESYKSMFHRFSTLKKWLNAELSLTLRLFVSVEQPYYSNDRYYIHEISIKSRDLCNFRYFYSCIKWLIMIICL